MKKTSLLFASVGIVLFAGACIFNACKRNSNAVPTTVLSTTQQTSGTHAKTSLNNYLANAITKADGNSMILDYANDPNIVPTSSFLFNAAPVLSFINESDGIVKLHCLLGEKTVDNVKQLVIMLCGVDAAGNHIYIKDGTPATDYIFDRCIPCPTCAVTNLQNPGPASNFVLANYPQNQLLSTAQLMVNTYQSLTVKNTTATSFLIDAANLANYMTNAPDIQKIQFFLGVTNLGVLTLVVAGIDSNGNQIYIKNGGINYAFDMTKPCPVCEITNQGVNLE